MSGENPLDRAVACVNACFGIEKPEEDLREARKDIAAAIGGLDSGKGSVPFIIACLRAALRKIGGSP